MRDGVGVAGSCGSPCLGRRFAQMTFEATPPRKRTTPNDNRSTRAACRRPRPVIELAICWTMSDDALDPQWTDPKGFSVVIEGEPRVDATIRFGLAGQV
jgi:hypothetical protein